MFWSGNYIVVRELNFLLKEENVTLSQVLEADDILQECKADNKALMQFLTRPDILAELITLITEEPPQNVELSQQYGHAHMACEVLTSPLSMLSDRLSLDTMQMNRLCDFINRDPPLNPLLASYFSKTIEMLLERSPKQDWYLYHIVCLRVLDFFKSRRDFLPNLLRHISTSAIVDIFKYFIRLDDLFNKIVMEWLEEHQFLESLIQIICGTYAGAAEPEGAQREAGAAAERAAAAASANAAALLCELVGSGCAAEGAAARSRTAWVLAARLAGAAGVRQLLQGVFTSAGAARASAVGHGCRLLLALLSQHPVLGADGAAERSQVELAVAPHLPLLHQALLRPPPAPGVGAARVHTAALLAHLALSEVEEVPATMLTLGTPAVLLDLFFAHPHNNFLHAQVLAFCRHAFANAPYRSQYARHLLVECDLLTRLMDAFEANESKPGGCAYSGHVTQLLRAAAAALEALEADAAGAAAARWPAFRDEKLLPLLHQLDTPLGGSYPSENCYEVDEVTDRLAGNYEFSCALAASDARLDGLDDAPDHDAGVDAEFAADALADDADTMESSKSNFLELASQRFDDDMWDDAPEADDGAADALGSASPWESAPADAAERAGEGWARFDGDAAPPADPFGDGFARPYRDYWPYDGAGGGADAVAGGLAAMSLAERPLSDERAVSLATSLLSAMSAMSPAALADLVDAGLAPLPALDAAAAPEETPAPAAVPEQESETASVPEIAFEPQIASEHQTASEPQTVPSESEASDAASSPARPISPPAVAAELPATAAESAEKVGDVSPATEQTPAPESPTKSSEAGPGGR